MIMLSHCFHCSSHDIERGDTVPGVFGPEIPCRCRGCGVRWAEIQGWDNTAVQEVLDL